MVATHTVVLYTDSEIIAEVYQGEGYMIPENIQVFNGTIEEFLEENPTYSSLNQH